VKASLRVKHLEGSKRTKEQETKEDERGPEAVTLVPKGQSCRPQEQQKRGQEKERLERRKGTAEHADPIGENHRDKGTPEARDHVEITLAGGLCSARPTAFFVSPDHLLYFCDLRG
jgi:hypothetical protein